MDDAKDEPVASGAGDRPDTARTATAEFRIPPKVDLTRPDIPVRRRAEPAAEPAAAAGTGEATRQDEAADEECAEPAEAAESEPEEAAEGSEVPKEGGAGPTRVERLPALPPKPKPTPTQDAAPAQVEPAKAEPAQEEASQDETAQDETAQGEVAQGEVAPSPIVPPSAQWLVPLEGAAPAAPPETPAAAGEAGEQGSERKRLGLVALVAALVMVAGLVGGQLVRPVPDPAVELAITSGHVFPGQAPELPWPSEGQSVVHVEGLGTMGSSGGTASIPTASVAKVMTAYVYLQEHPLEPGESGPVLTVSPEAAAQIPMRRQRGESILGITANQELTQRKALEALLIISANDVADELARWDAGSQEAFTAKMNAAARSLGMTGTRYTGASGYDSGTVSTAADQVKLLREAMRIPAFAEIVNVSAYQPQDGGPARQGGNFLLGRYGVIGGKTGYTDAAGGNFVFAARKDIGGVNTLIVGAVMGQQSSSASGAVTAAEQLVVAAEDAMVAATLAPAGARVARVDDGLGGKTALRAAAPVTVAGWPGLTVPVGIDGDPPRRAGSGARIATLTAGAASVPLELVRTLDEPSAIDRLTRLG